MYPYSQRSPGPNSQPDKQQDAQNYSAVSLAEGTYLWNATCWDGNNVVNQSNNLAASATQSFSVSIAPNVTLLSPPNATITGNATTQFFFNVSDETGLTSCSVLIEGAAVDTRPGIDLILGGVNAFNVSGLNNTFVGYRVCTRQTAQHNNNNGESNALCRSRCSPTGDIDRKRSLVQYSDTEHQYHSDG